MKISLIVPAFNEEKLIAGTLAGLQAAATVWTARGWAWEVIVCDNNSTDRTAELACAAGARVVFEPVNQIARARNCGARAATGEWLVFVDADSEPSAALLAQVAGQIVSGRCIAGGCTVAMDSGDWMVRALAALWNWISQTRTLMAGSFVFCAREAFWAVGGFNEELYAGEELDLSRRLHRLAAARGQRVVILREYPLRTSPRKAHLYRRREHLRFLMRTLLTGGQALRCRQSCYPWYDGRR